MHSRASSEPRRSPLRPRPPHLLTLGSPSRQTGSASYLRSFHSFDEPKRLHLARASSGWPADERWSGRVRGSPPFLERPARRPVAECRVAHGRQRAHMKPYWRYEHSDLLFLLPFHRHQRHWLIRLTGRGPLPESVGRYLCAGILMSFEDPRQSQDEVPGVLRRFSQNPLSGFAPWILFSVIGGPSTWETASIAALIAAVLLVLIDIRAADIVLSRVVPSTGDRPATPVRLRRPKLLDVATIVFFFGFVMAAGIANQIG